MATILITGAQGYIGRCLAVLARARGHVVRDAGAWRLGAEPPGEIFSGVETVVHLAHSWQNETAGSENINLEGSEKLARAAFAAGVRRFIFVSSVSADPKARNVYGRAKYATEERLAAPPGPSQSVVCARVGLVYGGEAVGQYGVMRKLARRFLLPMIGLGRQVQPIHVDDVAAGLLALATLPALLRPVYVLAAPRPMSFARWLRLLRRAATGSARMLLLPLPIWLVLAASRLLAVLPFAPKVDRERILGLAGTKFRPSADDLEALGLVLCDPAEKLVSPRFAVRAKLREGMVLLHYLLSRPPPRKSVIRFARLLEAYGETALDIPVTFQTMPGLTRLCDPVGGQSALARHLQIAAMVAEDAQVVRSRARRIFEIIPEILALPVRLFAGRQVP